MSGTSTPRESSLSRICGTAAAASLRSTVTRTSSEPARASAATWATVASIAAVSVLVIDCTTMGAVPPTITPPILTGIERRRAELSMAQGYIRFLAAAPGRGSAGSCPTSGPSAGIDEVSLRRQRLRHGFDIVAEHVEIGPGRPVRRRQGVGKERAADLGAGLLGDLVEQPRVSTFSRNTAGTFSALIWRMMFATSLAEASLSVLTPSGAMNSMP